MNYATTIAFFAVVIIAIILIHRDSRRVNKHYEDTLRRQIDQLKKL